MLEGERAADGLSRKDFEDRPAGVGDDAGEVSGSDSFRRRMLKMDSLREGSGDESDGDGWL